MKFISNIFKTFVSTLFYNNDENCDILNCKMFLIEDVNGLNVVFFTLHKKNGFSKLKTNGNML